MPSEIAVALVSFCATLSGLSGAVAADFWHDRQRGLSAFFALLALTGAVGLVLTLDYLVP